MYYLTGCCNGRAVKLIKVFFDGKCDVCSKEIRHYKSLDRDNKFDWINVAINGDALNYRGVTQADALLYLHVIDANDKLLVGVDAFITIWQELPRWWFVAIILKNPIFYQCAKHAYKYMAIRRFKKYQHCTLSSKSLS